jgi:hypothetical protein
MKVNKRLIRRLIKEALDRNDIITLQSAAQARDGSFKKLRRKIQFKYHPDLEEDEAKKIEKTDDFQELGNIADLLEKDPYADLYSFLSQESSSNQQGNQTEQLKNDLSKVSDYPSFKEIYADLIKSIPSRRQYLNVFMKNLSSLTNDLLSGNAKIYEFYKYAGNLTSAGEDDSSPKSPRMIYFKLIKRMLRSKGQSTINQAVRTKDLDLFGKGYKILVEVSDLPDYSDIQRKQILIENYDILVEDIRLRRIGEYEWDNYYNYVSSLGYYSFDIKKAFWDIIKDLKNSGRLYQRRNR